MISLQPREYFTIVRQLPDPGDLGTYYVQAVVKNSRTGDVIDTVNLIDKGNQRFVYPYQVPADSSNLGFFIDITTNVYTDSGYSTYSTVYGKDNNSYLVWDRIANRNSGGGGGADVDYKRIAKIFLTVLTPLVNLDEKGNIMGLKDQNKVDLQPVLAQLQAIHKTCMDMEMPEQKEPDLSPVFKAITHAHDSVIKTVTKALDEKEVPETTDIKPVLDAISKLDGKVAMNKDTEDALRTSAEKVVAVIEKLDGSETKIMNMVDKLRDAFTYSLALMQGKQDEKGITDRVKGLIKTL